MQAQKRLGYLTDPSLAVNNILYTLTLQDNFMLWHIYTQFGQKNAARVVEKSIF